MNRLKPILSVIIVICVVLPGHCQKKVRWLPAYIVTWKLDTLAGYIDLKQGMLTPNKLRFKKDLSLKTTHFTPMELRSFCVRNRDEYITENILPIDVRIDGAGDIQLDTLPPKLVFLRTLATGNFINLYAFGERLFFIKQPATNIFEQLIFGNFNTTESFIYNTGVYISAMASLEHNSISHSSRTVTTMYYGYRQRLSAFVAKNSLLSMMVWAADYNADQLAQIVNAINRSATTVNPLVLAMGP